MRFEALAETGSTNEEARRRAESGERGPLWIRADRQTAGRGRRGRSWIGLSGNLFCTGLYGLDVRPAEAAQLSFAAALAVAELCETVADPVQVRVKWPNDVLIAGRKAAGVLLESGAAPGGGLWLAVGVGVNLAAHPDDAERPATHLGVHGSAPDPQTAMERIAAAFERWRSRWAEAGFAPIRDAWLTRAYGIGERCEARLANETVSGVFADLEADGSLRLDLAAGGRRYISAGDVYFPD